MIILGACATQQTLAPESIEFRALHAAVESGNTHSMIVLKNGAPIFAYGDVHANRRNVYRFREEEHFVHVVRRVGGTRHY